MCICVLCAHMHAGTYRGQKRALDPLKLEVQTAVSCLMDGCDFWDPNSNPLKG